MTPLPALAAGRRRAVAAALLALSTTGCLTGRRVGDEVVTTVRQAEVSFEFRSCIRRRDVLTCTLMVANESRDAKLFFERKDVRAVADGVELPIAQIRFGGVMVQEVNYVLQNGVPMKLEVEFANTRDIGERLRVLDLTVSLFDKAPTGEWTRSLLGDDLTRAIRFRNLKIE